jgi:hypothetical protein
MQKCSGNIQNSGVPGVFQHEDKNNAERDVMINYQTVALEESSQCKNSKTAATVSTFEDPFAAKKKETTVLVGNIIFLNAAPHTLFEQLLSLNLSAPSFALDQVRVVSGLLKCFRIIISCHSR